MPVPLNSSFFERCARQHASTQKEEGPYNPRLLLGDYSQEVLCYDAGRPGLVEPFIVRQLQRELRRDPDALVAALDSGSGVGVSWLRIGLRFKQEIQDGRLHLAASSLHGEPRAMLDAAWAAYDERGGDESGVTKRQLDEAERLLDRSGDLVSFVPVHPQTVGDDPQKLLHASYHVIHERRGGAPWSWIPESHILRLGSLVAGRGCMMLYGLDIGEPLGMMKRSEHAERQQAMLGAYETLSGPTHGLTQVLDVEAGKMAGHEMEYLIYKGRDAPPVTIG